MKFYKEIEYKDACEKLFHKYKASISLLVPHARVEHVGSSSIPGALSKGDLDIFVGVAPGELEASVALLKTLGFTEKAGTLRTAELCMLESVLDNVAFQIVVNGSQFEFFIAFREKLKASETLLEQYNLLKLNCVGFPEVEYRRLKADFIGRVLRDT